jgi:hypothetical protein
MPSRIVTYIQHPKRAPRKKAEAPAGPAVVQSSVKPFNDPRARAEVGDRAGSDADPSHGRLGG